MSCKLNHFLSFLSADNTFRRQSVDTNIEIYIVHFMLHWYCHWYCFLILNLLKLLNTYHSSLYCLYIFKTHCNYTKFYILNFLFRNIRSIFCKRILKHELSVFTMMSVCLSLLPAVDFCNL